MRILCYRCRTFGRKPTRRRGRYGIARPIRNCPAIRNRPEWIRPTSPVAPAGRRNVPENRDLLVRRLRRQGHDDIATAADGIEAIAAIQAAVVDGEPFDAVLLDVMMPRMSGVEVPFPVVRIVWFEFRAAPILCLCQLQAGPTIANSGR
jgi:hypothetical protein